MRAGLRNSMRHAPHHERRRLAAAGAVDQRAVIVADQAQEIGAAALAPADIAAVIDEAGEVGVLEIDADGQNVAAPCWSTAIRPARSGQLAGRDWSGGAAAWAAETWTMTISGGTPMRTGRIEQPSPPDTIRLRLPSTMWP